MADTKKLQGEWQALNEYAEELSVQEKADAKRTHEGNEVEWLDTEEVLELEATKKAATPKKTLRQQEKRREEWRPTQKEDRSSRSRPSKKDSHPRCSRPAEKDRHLKRSVSRRLDSEERHRQLRWLRNETWLTLKTKTKGATLDELLKSLSLDGCGSVESRIRTLGYPSLAVFLSSAYMQHEVEIVCQEGKTSYFSKAKKGSARVKKEVKETTHRLKKLTLDDVDKQEETPCVKAKSVEASKMLAKERQEPMPEGQREANEDDVQAMKELQEVDEQKADGMEPLPLKATRPLAEELKPLEASELPTKDSELQDAEVLLDEDVDMSATQAGEQVADELEEAAGQNADGTEQLPQEASDPQAEEPKLSEAPGLTAKAPQTHEPAERPAEDVEMPEVENPAPVAEARALPAWAIAEAYPDAAIPETPEEPVAFLQRYEHRHRVPAVLDLESLEELLLATGPISFTPMDADRRFKWQRLHQPGVADVALVPAPAEPIPSAMRPVLEVALEALQSQPNPEALTAADIHRVLSETLAGKKVWTHEMSVRFHVKKISMDNAFEAEIRSQANFIASYATQFPHRNPLHSRAPHCPIDMPTAAVFRWKRMPLRLPWWPMIVGREKKIGLWPLERAYIVLNEEQVPGQEGGSAASPRQDPEVVNRNGHDEASYREGRGPGGRGNGGQNGRPSLDDRVRRLQASGRFDFAEKITGLDRGLIVEMPTARAEVAQTRRIEVRCEAAPRIEEQQSGSEGRKPQLRSLIVIPPHSSFAGAPRLKKPRSDGKPYSYVCRMCHKFHASSIPPNADPRFCDCPSQWGPSSSNA